MVIMGCTAAGAGIMLRSCVVFTLDVAMIFSKMILMVSSGVIFYLYRSENAIIFCMFMCGIISLYIESEN